MNHRKKKDDPVIALMTDFGTEDTYIGQMKGVILSICPSARIIDLTHAVKPQHIALGAFLLERSIPYLPDGAIAVSIVDPGVGTSRKPIAVKTERLTFLAPDNGLLTPVLSGLSIMSCSSIANPDIMLPLQSATFHGRDIFSPAAAHLAEGFPFEKLGDPLHPTSCITLQQEECGLNDHNRIIEGRVLFADRFGNLVTTIDTSRLHNPEEWHLEAPGLPPLQLVRTYGDADEGELLAYGGSFGTVEIAVRNGNAAMTTRLEDNTSVRLVKN
ncbi:MAG: SAM-dependent chlorinase/fluorinase [Chlorobium sp.]|jgi:S-adenosylmethionine hydrolase|uniref:SAM hydrolase/SAM-dependent halogenase family protein n=1 Tax=Chlorobium sp. TaxID=1095 RepID=UPI001DA0DFD1|nr:SAM-dependent chlorinase/fluorinase [Chlorobium sp.]MBN1279604.1 SAM-dependent chlorinase/fluorinase [Chlorobiaceae bacterium]MCF8215498.1 SAM-dependent chlorinase/fluorinase [Chlorobium sp.]MCF8270277.1 SAM-dependent chlorinase/fluorinase [Chlorobium sp.]MCF8286705.1 SAM-dependent chlorinase/fluorinase [Chlorobium sp.]MCF8290398.1 SAM-dependent chlorinase/fluorinase [Chlorobium sp.]